MKYELFVAVREVEQGLVVFKPFAYKIVIHMNK